MQSVMRLVTAAIVSTIMFSGCSKPNTPPRAYTAAPKGAASVEELVDNFKKAHAARDADAAMQMFYWQTTDYQDFWWVSLSELVESPYDDIEVISPQADKESVHPPPKTTLPVVARLRITTNTTPTSRSEQVLLIGENENGFYFTPPVNK